MTTCYPLSDDLSISSSQFQILGAGPWTFYLQHHFSGRWRVRRVTQSVVCLPGTNTRHSEYRLGSSTVSIEKWLYPERVYKEEIAREEILGLEKVDNLKLEHHDDCIGQWRSFNRIASPTQVAERRSSESISSSVPQQGFNFRCEVREWCLPPVSQT